MESGQEVERVYYLLVLQQPKNMHVAIVCLF